MPPPVPVIVMVLFPVLAPWRTVIVIDEVPEPGAAIDEGLKLTVTPDGMPDADNAIAELRPPETVVVIVEVPELPQARPSEAGDALTVKSPPLPTGATFRETVVVWVAPPLVPVMVIG
jgi:hypothetical protein